MANTNIRPGTSCSDLVTLNVGGELFTAERATLLTYPNSLFEEILEDEAEVTTDQNGVIFIDQSPEVFKVILCYLTDGTINFNKTGVSFMKLREAARFYHIWSLTSKLKEKCSSKDYDVGKVLTTPYSLPKPYISPPGTEGKVRSVKIQANWAILIYTDFVVAHDLVTGIHWKSLKLSGITHAEAYLYGYDDTCTDPWNTQEFVLCTQDELHIWKIHRSYSRPKDCTDRLPLRAEFCEIEDVKCVMSKLLLVIREPATKRWHVNLYAKPPNQSDWHCTEISSSCVVTSPLVVYYGEAFYATQCQIWRVFSMEQTKVFLEKTQQTITTLSMTRNESSVCEIAYGTTNGKVGIIRKADTKPFTPYLLMRTFWVHSSEIMILSLSHRYLVSMCSNDNHIRTWELQKYPNGLNNWDEAAPMKEFSLDAPTKEDEQNHPTKTSVNLGPFCCSHNYGDKNVYLFLQRPTLRFNKLFFRRVTDCKTICTVKSPNGSPVIGWAMQAFYNEPGEADRECTPKLITTHEDGQTYIWNTGSCDLNC